MRAKSYGKKPHITSLSLALGHDQTHQIDIYMIESRRSIKLQMILNKHWKLLLALND